MKIAFVGGGHIAAAMIAGIRAASDGQQAEIIVADRNEKKRRMLQNTFGVIAADSQSELPPDAKMLILAVKPADIPGVCEKISQRNAIVVSVAAGVSLSSIAARMPFSPQHLARAMPNTPLASGRGMTMCYADAPDDAKAKIAALFNSAGEVLWAKNESMLAAATAVSGCGPAYLYYLAEAMEEWAVAAGFSAAEARQLTAQTLRGGGEMLHSRPESAADLRLAVAVRGGATERAIAEMAAKDLKQIVRNAMSAAQNRAQELGKESPQKTNKN